MGTVNFNKVPKDIATTTFDCGVASINDYIRKSYYPTIAQECYTYQIESEGHVIGYYQILFRDVQVDEFPDKISDVIPEIKDNTISAVHIRFLAIDSKYQRMEPQHLGTWVLRTIIKQVQELSKIWPVRVITIDARNNLIDWYKREGFLPMKKNTPGQDFTSTQMYFDCLHFPKELEEYMQNFVEQNS